MFITNIITTKIPWIQQQQNPHRPIEDGISRFQSTIDWLSQISLHPITPMPYSKHECGTQTERTNEGILRLNHLSLIKQKSSMIAIHPGSLGQHNKRVIIRFTVIYTRLLGQHKHGYPRILSAYIMRNFPISQSLRLYRNPQSESGVTKP